MKKIFYVNIFFLVLVLIQICGGYALNPIIKSLHLNLGSVLILTQILFLIIPVIIYLVVTRQSPVKALRIKPLKIGDLSLVILIGFLVIPIASFLGLITNLVFHNNVGDVLSKMSSLPLGFMIVVVALTPAVCEEITMRGAVLSGYRKIGVHKAAVITGLLFGILHLNPSQFLYTFVLGIILAYMVNATGSIFSSMICHFVFNGFNVISAWRTLRNGVKPPDITTLDPNLRNSMFITLFIASIISVVIIIAIIRKLKKNNMGSVASEDSRNDNLYGSSRESSEGVSINPVTAYSPIIVSAIIYCIFIFNNYVKL
ncbi:putative metal-dependent membrane protease [Clostridium pasteurianum DSM 525 = ATCC 6013]|uniref:Abortive infection protein n=1 Tax=Clostridium pasteurianum DSM 525 = ATCC 6013 TaxID=1262449 RepID=A0A0H3J0U1_CLOPA|nr:type II CAAX endopeptidase family protein [Clostridium pasteurianum]AJA46292.1 putative metal-dependent membrane protease [Clostridium pasteurianum DSM 525 = ATCC 6013]AJA50280.1 putative metal-dependent membrane protease [Clostridium pasteurianum DSM 525 = ATCC 6013]AOZ73743.1 metal-dependent membrane protease [Clostridium pasteurianum DSM 525 = ATCC 6013]AOZ77540.1 metal-dependent membrane protease [Clostridium pasteurianum]ELP60876.1 hypothetical protein F502_00405 [Clostridium pasteuria